MSARVLVLRLCVGWLILAIGAALLVGLLPLPDPEAIDLRARLRPPVFLGGGWAHPLGTDELGRDVLTRTLYGLRLSLLLALFGTLMGAVVGTALGFLASHFRGLVDDAVMVAIDLQASIPFFLIAVILVAVFGASFPLFLGLISLFGWERYARLARAMALSAEAAGYAEALRGVGAGPGRIYLRHILPNIAGPLIVATTLNFPETILLESSMSFLGIGVQPPMVSLGNMVGYGQDYLLTAWWISACPAAAIFLCTVAMAFIGDALGDYVGEGAKPA